MTIGIVKVLDSKKKKKFFFQVIGKGAAKINKKE